MAERAHWASVPYRKKFDGIYLGRRKGRSLIYAGKVDHSLGT
jgi:hypothetical protein